MSMQDPANEAEDEKRTDPYKVTLPGFISGDDIGLGDVIKRVTYAMGFKPCTGCERRAADLNRRVVFTSKSNRG